MTVSGFDPGTTYSRAAGFVFIFNLMVGTGSLTMPAAFQQAGWAISLFNTFILCFFSFVTFSFIIESMSLSNAIVKLNRRNKQTLNENNSTADSELMDVDLHDMPPYVLHDDDYEISEKFELGHMFLMFFGRIGNVLFYLNICIYLFGDLSIYASAVPKSLRNVVCASNSSETAIPESNACWSWSELTRSEIHRIFVACFAVCMCPFLFFNVTRSRWLQWITVAVRWLAFILMLCLAIERTVVIRLGYRMPSLKTHSWNPAVHSLFNHPEPIPNPPIARLQGIPNFFGVCVYVFMCHHSIPGLVTPVKNKHKIYTYVFIPVYVSVFIFNLLLSGTAVAAFNRIADLYTLNFIPNEEFIDISRLPRILALIFGYFLSLFPVFALTSTFPIVATTLLGNIRCLLCFFPTLQSVRAQRILRFILPFIVVFPPCAVAIGTDNIGFLAGFTGAFLGSGIQYIIPSVLVYRARQYLKNQVNSLREDHELQIGNEQNSIQTYDASTSNMHENDEVKIVKHSDTANHSKLWVLLFKPSPNISVSSPFASPFQNIWWLIFLFIWALICIVLILMDKINPV